MTVFSNYCRRILRRPWTIVLAVAIPALIVVISNAGGGGNHMRVAFIDRDASLLSRIVRDAVAPAAHFVEVEYDEIAAALVDGRIEYAIVVPEGMQVAVVAGERARVETFSLQGVQMTRLVRSAADAVFSAAHNVALEVDGDAARFEAVMERMGHGRLALTRSTFRADKGALTTGQAAGMAQLIGLLTLTMLLTTMATCLVFLTDVENGTFHRSIAGPLSLMRYTAETNIAFFGVTALQGIATVVVLRLIFPGLGLGVLLNVGAVLLAFALVAVSFTLAIANTMKTVKRTAIAINLLSMPIVMLGGAFWPFDIMPDYLQRIGAFSPTRWTTAATADALSGAAFSEILPQLGILVLFAIVFQMLGSWRRVDVAK